MRKSFGKGRSDPKKQSLKILRPREDIPPFYSALTRIIREVDGAQAGILPEGQIKNIFSASDVLRLPLQLLSYAPSHLDEPEESKSYIA